jgi:excisionase family DNA binding protein
MMIAATLPDERMALIGGLFGSYPELMGIEQVAGALGVCANTVRAMIYKHQIPAKKIGKKWYILRSDLRTWVATSDN